MAIKAKRDAERAAAMIYLQLYQRGSQG